MSDTGLPRRPSPGGKKPSRNILIFGGVAAAGLVYWMYKKNATASSSGTTDPNIDPATGQPYSSEYYDSSSSGAVGTTPSLYGYTDPFGNLITNPSTTNVVTAPSTNEAWAQQAASYLVNQGQYDAATVYAALGMYVGSAGKANLTDDQYAIVEAAYGYVGKPPNPIDPPHVSPPTGQTVATVAPGYYRNIVNGAIVYVEGTTYHPVSATSWKKIVATKPKVTSVLPTDKVWRLTRGSSI